MNVAASDRRSTGHPHIRHGAQIADDERRSSYRNAEHLKGRAIVTLSDAAKIGEVDDILFDSEYRQVLGFTLKHGPFGTTEAVSRDRVSTVGQDALSVTGPDAVNALDRLTTLTGASSLSKAQQTQLVTESGTQSWAPLARSNSTTRRCTVVGVRVERRTAGRDPSVAAQSRRASWHARAGLPSSVGVDIMKSLPNGEASLPP